MLILLYKIIITKTTFYDNIIKQIIINYILLNMKKLKLFFLYIYNKYIFYK